MKRNNKISENKNAFSIIAVIIFCVYSFTILYPFFWALITSVKDSLDFLDNKFMLPSSEFGWKFSTYLDAIKAFKVPVGINDVYFPELFLNSMVFTLLLSTVNLIIPMSVSYVVCKYPRYKLSGILHSTVIIMIILPLEGGLPAMLRLLNTLKVYDSLLGLAMMRWSFLGTNFLIFYASFKCVSNDYMSAAKIDGAGNWYIFLKVMIPMIMPTLAGLFLLAFIANWNNYTTALVYWPSHPTISYALFRLNTTTIQRFTVPMKMASVIICSVPIVTLFLLSMKKVVGNITIGGLKG